MQTLRSGECVLWQKFSDRIIITVYHSISPLVRHEDVISTLDIQYSLFFLFLCPEPRMFDDKIYLNPLSDNRRIETFFLLVASLIQNFKFNIRAL